MAAKEVSAKTIRIHAMLVFIVCTLFGLISFVRKAYLMGLCTVGMGAVIPLVALVLMRDSSKIARGMFLTQTATVVIAALSAALMVRILLKDCISSLQDAEKARALSDEVDQMNAVVATR